MAGTAGAAINVSVRYDVDFRGVPRGRQAGEPLTPAEFQAWLTDVIAIWQNEIEPRGVRDPFDVLSVVTTVAHKSEARPPYEAYFVEHAVEFDDAAHHVNDRVGAYLSEVVGAPDRDEGPFGVARVTVLAPDSLASSP